MLHMIWLWSQERFRDIRNIQKSIKNSEEIKGVCVKLRELDITIFIQLIVYAFLAVPKT